MTATERRRRRRERSLRRRRARQLVLQIEVAGKFYPVGRVVSMAPEIPWPPVPQWQPEGARS